MLRLLSVAAGGLLVAVLSLQPMSHRATRPLAEHLRSEAVRLRAHFDSVDSELRLSSTLHLTQRQREARATLVRWLGEYRDAGRFPLNDRHADRVVPIFRDSRGVLCAMAYLIDRSGRGDLVDRVAATRNTASIAELSSDPELIRWLDSTGLSVAEAGLVQPSYGGPLPGPEEPGVSAGYGVSSIVLGGGALASIGLNAFKPSRTSAVAGIFTGAGAFLLGAAKPERTGPTVDVATANIIVGTGALAAGIYRLVTLEREQDQTPPAQPSSGPEVTITPLMEPAPGGPRFGLAFHSTF